MIPGAAILILTATGILPLHALMALCGDEARGKGAPVGSQRKRQQVVLVVLG